MTNPKKKPAPKGVPMPRPLRYFECSWIQDIHDVLIPWARAIQWTAHGINIGDFEAEYKAVRKWTANPQQPKGVRR